MPRKKLLILYKDDRRASMIYMFVCKNKAFCQTVPFLTSHFGMVTLFMKLQREKNGFTDRDFEGFAGFPAVAARRCRGENFAKRSLIFTKSFMTANKTIFKCLGK